MWGFQGQASLEVVAARFHQDLSTLVTESNAILRGRLGKNIYHRRLARRMSEIAHSRSAAVRGGLRAELWEARILQPGELLININKWWGKKKKYSRGPSRWWLQKAPFCFEVDFMSVSARRKRHYLSSQYGLMQLDPTTTICGPLRH